MANIYTSAQQLVGNTPLLQLTNIMKKEGLEGEFFSDGEHRPRAFFAHP